MFDLAGPGQRLTQDLTAAFLKKVVSEIQEIDPGYRFSYLGIPTTADGQNDLIASLKRERASAYARVKGDLRPLQAETTRFMHQSATKWYERALQEWRAGRIDGATAQLAIGRYIDRNVRTDLRQMYNMHRIPINREGIIRINNREYRRTEDETSYKIPDARIGNIAFDVTLTRKTLATEQIRGFFGADFKPVAVVIIRPGQLGPNASYVIIRPKD